MYQPSLRGSKVSRKNLPPLEVGAIYRAKDFEGFEFLAQPLQMALTGEDTAILRLKLSNATTLEIPASESELQDLLLTLIDAYGPVAIDHLKKRDWIKD